MTVKTADDLIMRGCLLDLKIVEGIGTKTQDWAKPHHEPVTLTGAPSWTDVDGLPVLDFNKANPDFIEISAVDSADLDFTSGDFSGFQWVYDSGVGAQFAYMVRGLVLADGWLFYRSGTRYVFETESPSRRQSRTDDGIVITGSWIFLGFVRNGTSGRIYVNGVDLTTGFSSHVAVTTSNRKLHLGIYDDEINWAADGKMYRPRIWNRALTKDEIRAIFETERELFGV